MPESKVVETPKFTWLVLIGLGILDLVRGFMHTAMIRYAAPNIAGLDLSCAGQDQMFLLGVFGISNYLTGAMLILIGLKARHLAPTMLALIPIVYLVGARILRTQVAPQSAFLGQPFMLAYLAICAVTCVASVVVMRRRK
jgi:hypothetical protein